MMSPTCSPYARYLLTLGDSSLIAAQQLIGWVGSGPALEEEIALSNIALDLLGHANMLLDLAAKEGVTASDGHVYADADALAYSRDTHEFFNVLLVERPNGDFAQTIVRQLAYASWAYDVYSWLAAHSAHAELAGIADKAAGEVAYHLSHTSEWLIRLGDGTEESHMRTQNGVNRLWPYTGELFTPSRTEIELAHAGTAPDLSQLHPTWKARMALLFKQATLSMPDETTWMQSGGKDGRHTERLGFILAEMQYLQRTYPGASW